YFFGCKDVDLS
ncbi:PTS system N-acetylmuramic acid-specific EIIBC component, partial [Vibrio parahaemolyticus SBR10290]